MPSDNKTTPLEPCTEPKNGGVTVETSAREAARINADVRWWRDRLPPKWNLLGFTERVTAAAVSPAGRRVDLDGEFLEAVHEATR